MIQSMPVKDKDQVLSVRVDIDELARWEAAADAAGLRLSAWIRQTCNLATPQLREKAGEVKQALNRKRGGKS